MCIIQYLNPRAGVVKLVDARDSKSRGPQAHESSILSAGTRFLIGKKRFYVLLYSSDKCSYEKTSYPFNDTWVSQQLH